MVVANNLDTPIKIVYPQNGFTRMKDFFMLGLGDVVIPGSFVSLALRFDYFRACEKAVDLSKVTSKDTSIKVPLPCDRYGRPYFYAAFAGYIAGLTA